MLTAFICSTCIFSSAISLEVNSIEKYSSLYTGVSYFKRDRKCQASFYINNKQFRIGKYELAADAAWAHDLCLQQLDVSSKEPNFKTTVQYHIARKKEAKDRGINTSQSDIQEYLHSKLANAVSAVVKEGGTLRHPEKKEAKSSNNERWASSNLPRAYSCFSFLTKLHHFVIAHVFIRIVQSTDHGKNSKPLNKTSKNFSSTYIGAYHDKRKEIYFSTIAYDKKNHYLGGFEICADAAMMYDSCIQCIEGSSVSKVNFSSQLDYERAREQEMEERGIISPKTVNALATINARVEKFLSKVGKNNGSNGMSRTAG